MIRTLNRRHFLQGISTLTAGALLTSNGVGAQLVCVKDTEGIDIRDDTIKQLVHRALDAARSAGAEYADVRLVRRQERAIGLYPDMLGDNDFAGIDVGVRARVGGAWGFASHPSWTGHAVTQTAQTAVDTARAHAVQGGNVQHWIPVPVVIDQHWASPIKIDPFTVAVAEMKDIFEGLRSHAIAEVSRAKVGAGANGATVILYGGNFHKRQIAFGSTEGAYGTQTLYVAEGRLEEPPGRQVWLELFRVNAFTPAMAGWEMFCDDAHDIISKEVGEFAERFRLPQTYVDVGRYDTVFDAETVASLVGETLGIATELDRAMGEDAHAVGTSYLDDPLAMVGTESVGSSALSVEIDRTMVGGAATVAWDDEGTPAERLPLVEAGILQRFQSGREGAGWLRSTAGQGAGCTGCMQALTGSDMPMVTTGNLRVKGPSSSLDLDDLIAGMEHGIFFRATRPLLDFQKLTGATLGCAYLVRGGKLQSRLAGAGILFKSPELWKNITLVGDAREARRFGFQARKSDIGSTYYYSVDAPPMAFKNMTIIDMSRK